MKACGLYFSITDNAMRFAETISERLKIPASDITVTEPCTINDFETLILGTSFRGFNCSKELFAFVESLPQGNGKKIILFCTSRLWKGRTSGKLKKELKKKGIATFCVLKKRARILSRRLLRYYCEDSRRIDLKAIELEKKWSNTHENPFSRGRYGA
jgi:flavodoxin